jgi:hypothetical protein
MEVVPSLLLADAEVVLDTMLLGIILLLVSVADMVLDIMLLLSMTLGSVVS